MDMKFEKPKSSIERVVGATSEVEKEILKEKAELFDNQIFESLKGAEREKNAEDLEMIGIANYATNAMRLKYGMEEFDIPAQNFHIIPGHEWVKDQSLDGIAGVYNSSMQAVVMRDTGATSLVMLSTFIHEALHFKSYNALQILDADNRSEKIGLTNISKAKSYRDGLMTRSRDGKEHYFSELNEAITEELSKRLMAGMKNELEESPLFAEEIRQTQELIKKHSSTIADNGRRLFTSDTLYAETTEPDNFLDATMIFLGKRSEKIRTKVFAYGKQRRMLNSLIDKVWSKHKDIYKDQEEVFDVFAKAYMTGNLLTIGRLIEDTFGEGTFRKIGELNMRPEKKASTKAA